MVFVFNLFPGEVKALHFAQRPIFSGFLDIRPCFLFLGSTATQGPVTPWLQGLYE